MTTRGYSIDRRNKKKPYKVSIYVDGKSIWLGNFATPEEASNTYWQAREKHPRKPRSGGNPNWRPPRQVCENCNDLYTVHLFHIHYRSCIEKYPKGRPPGYYL